MLIIMIILLKIIIIIIEKNTIQTCQISHTHMKKATVNCRILLLRSTREDISLL